MARPTEGESTVQYKTILYNTIQKRIIWTWAFWSMVPHL